jgi:hypothetical protein
MDREALVTKAKGRKSAGRAAKVSVLTRGRSRLVPERATRRESQGEKSAEVVGGVLGLDEGPNGKEGEAPSISEPSLKQISSQVELAFGSRGEAASAGRSAETAPAKRGSERPGASDLMEAVCERRNLQAALKRVRQNRGSPGIDGMTVEESGLEDGSRGTLGVGRTARDGSRREESLATRF